MVLHASLEYEIRTLMRLSRSRLCNDGAESP